MARAVVARCAPHSTPCTSSTACQNAKLASLCSAALVGACLAILLVRYIPSILAVSSQLEISWPVEEKAAVHDTTAVVIIGSNRLKGFSPFDDGTSMTSEKCPRQIASRMGL